MRARALLALRFVAATSAKVFLVGVPAFASLYFGVLLGQCQTLAVLHSFAGGTDGQYPYASLVRDSAGNFYGTTGSGGRYKNGSVFKLSPKSGRWTTSLIYSFKGAPDGSGPAGSLVFDTKGNLYGTTVGGGTSAGVCGTYGGCGTVFKLAPAAGGKWTEVVLHRFKGGSDGVFPYAGLTFNRGKLFGLTSTGGGNGTGCFYLGCGVIFEMSPASKGEWQESLAYTFTGGNDGGEPWYGSLVSDASGNLYGATTYTGCDGCVGYYPTVFQLSPNGTGGWTLNTLYTFTDYSFSFGGLVFDNAGNLYGTTNSSAYGYGVSSQGSVFQLTKSGGSWSLSTLHSFSGNSDGKYPFAGITLDAAGNLYGTAEEGGNSSCSVNGYTGCGVVFKMAPGSGGIVDLQHAARVQRTRE
jgi:uncharacterized repeat protein (TIGR03803 family)